MTDLQRKPVIFISYRSEDEKIAQDLANSIRSDFLEIPEVFIASQMEPGIAWQDEIREKLSEAAIFCVLQSEKSETRWVSMEIGAAWIIKATLIPICYGALKKSDLPDILSSRQAVDITSKLDLDKLYRKIASVIGCRPPSVSDQLIRNVDDFHSHYKSKPETIIYASKQSQRVAQLYDRMPDGTTKTLSPITGTLVWEIATRGKRPFPSFFKEPKPIDKNKTESYCVFCEARYAETPPEISRFLVKDGSHKVDYDITYDKVLANPADFRRIPNLFPILSYNYWRMNYGYEPDMELKSRREKYIATESGREHAKQIIDYKRQMSGGAGQEYEMMEQELFYGSHDIIIARHHFTPDAKMDNEHTSSGELTIEEHYQYIEFTIESIKDLYRHNKFIKYVTVFQNWLTPAGATLDHLHKQLVGIDEYGLPISRFIEARKQKPNLFDELLHFAFEHKHIIAENEHAIAFVEVGRRYPTIGVYSKSQHGRIEEHNPEEVRAMSDMLHACHAALGNDAPTNEEWYCTPPDVEEIIPWHILILLRTNIQAGFEHATRIHINPYPSEILRNKLTEALYNLTNKDKDKWMGLKIGWENASSYIRLA